MPFLLYPLAALIGALGWAFVTRQEGEQETVRERITTNLGAAAIAGAAAVAGLYFWRKGQG